MFMAAGMRFYTGAMFMLVAHASYKALMFLGAGSVMLGCAKRPTCNGWAG